MKITITMSDEVYGKLEKDRGLVPRSTYLQSLVMGGKQGNSAEKGTISNPRIIEVPEVKGAEPSDRVDEFLYEDIVSRIANSFEYELDYEGRADLNKAIKEAGLVWNSNLKKLEKPLGDKFKLIHQF